MLQLKKCSCESLWYKSDAKKISMGILRARQIWSGLCMSSFHPLHRQAAQHFDERFICKQTESFLSQPEQTIWVSRHRTLRTQYLHLGVFLWKQYKILASYSFCLCTPLLTLTKSFFSSIHQLKLSSSKTFFTRWSVSVMTAFPFLRSRFC